MAQTKEEIMAQRTKQSIRLKILADYASYVVSEYTDLIKSAREGDLENLATDLQAIIKELTFLEETALCDVASSEREDMQF